MKRTFPLIAVFAAFAAINVSAAGNGSPFDGAGLSVDQAVQAPAVPTPSSGEQALPVKAVPAHGFSYGEQSAMRAHNSGLQESFNKGLALGEDERVERKYRPFADYEAPGYLIMSADFNFNSSQAKLLMASKLPADGTLVIFTDYDDAGTKENIVRAYPH